MLRNFMFSLMVLTPCLFSNSLSLENNGDGTWNVGYVSDTAIGGFQFNVDGASVVSASGGAAELNGFTVSVGGSTVIGFSFTGSFIPAGSGVLTTLSIDGNADDVCLSDLVISGLSAALDSQVLDCLTISLIFCIDETKYCLSR